MTYKYYKWIKNTEAAESNKNNYNPIEGPFVTSRYFRVASRERSLSLLACSGTNDIKFYEIGPVIFAIPDRVNDKINIRFCLFAGDSLHSRIKNALMNIHLVFGNSFALTQMLKIEVDFKKN